MNRINYLVSPFERFAGTTPALPAPHLRRPLAALAASIALVAAAWCTQAVRLNAARSDGARYAQRLAAVEGQVAHVRALQRDLIRLRTIANRISHLRASGSARASEIAALGNRLPPDAWLTSLHIDRAAVSVEGRSARLGGVGSAMTSLAALPRFESARLVAVHSDPVHAGVTYAIALERKP
jgi:Tfp pilus assembly protein PilN